MTEERKVNELKYRSVEIIQSEEYKRKRLTNKQRNKIIKASETNGTISRGLNLGH